jgi:ribulose-5-phosphate 4-epimerase/fuculose-1-phosphate aldolase
VEQERQLRETVATASRILARLGLVDYMGHVSGRVAGTDRIVTKARHSETIRGMDSLSAEQMIVCHLQGHGIVTAAASVEEATIYALHLERLARANYLALQLGTPRVITPDEIDRLKGPMVGYKVRWAYYRTILGGPPTSALPLALR